MLPKRFRLDTKALGDFFHHKPTFYKGTVLTLRMRKNNSSTSRWAFLVSSSIKKNAASRNLAKRRMREAAKKLQVSVKSGYDLVFFLKLDKKNDPSFRALQDDMIETLKQCGLL